MNVLLWQATVLPGLDEAFEAFTNTRMLQFFQQQRGCLGVSFLQHGQQFQCVSYWHQQQDARQMLASPAYQQLMILLLQHYLVNVMPAGFAQFQGGFLSRQAQQQLAFCHATEASLRQQLGCS